MVPPESVAHVDAAAFARSFAAGLSAWAPQLPDPWSSAQRKLEAFAVDMRGAALEAYGDVCIRHATELAAVARRLPDSGATDILPHEGGLSPACDCIPQGHGRLCEFALRQLEAVLRAEAYLAPEPFATFCDRASSVAAAEALAAAVARRLQNAPDWRCAEAGAWSLAEGLERFVNVMRRLVVVVERSAPEKGAPPMSLQALVEHAKSSQNVGRLLVSFSALAQSSVFPQDPFFSAASRAGVVGKALVEAARALEQRADHFKTWLEDELPEAQLLPRFDQGPRSAELRSITELAVTSGKFWGAVAKFDDNAGGAPLWWQEEEKRWNLVGKFLKSEVELRRHTGEGDEFANLADGSAAGRHAGMWVPMVVPGSRADPASAKTRELRLMQEQYESILSGDGRLAVSFRSAPVDPDGGRRPPKAALQEALAIVAGTSLVAPIADGAFGEDAGQDIIVNPQGTGPATASGRQAHTLPTAPIADSAFVVAASGDVVVKPSGTGPSTAVGRPTGTSPAAPLAHGAHAGAAGEDVVVEPSGTVPSTADGRPAGTLPAPPIADAALVVATSDDVVVNASATTHSTVGDRPAP